MSNKLSRKWQNKRINAIKENIGFDLTFDQFKTLLTEVNITVYDIGNKG